MYKRALLYIAKCKRVQYKIVNYSLRFVFMPMQAALRRRDTWNRAHNTALRQRSPRVLPLPRLYSPFAMAAHNILSVGGGAH
jgi:hypothetical protein